MKTVKIFISSPNDVKVEREIAKELIENLKIEFEEEILFDVYLYEEHHQTANRGDFQKQINKYLEQSDIAIFIIWSTLGSPMSSYDGPYSNNKGVTGTEYEFEMALKLWEKNKKPEILVYRKTKEITLPPQKESYEYKQKLEKIEKVNNFFQTWFKNQQNSIKRAFYEFKELDDLKTYLQNHIKSIILEKNYKETKITHPYKGLDSFDFEDRTIFFGRDDEIKAFMKDWNKEPFIVVFGPSGSGKSSFIKAGILPYLLEKEKGDFLVTRPVELSQNPFEILSKKFFKKYKSSFNSLTYTLEDLQKRFESLDILPLQQILNNNRFYLLIDQFEEIVNIPKELREKYLQFLQLCIEKLNILILTTIRTNSLDILEETITFRKIKKFSYRLTFPPASNIIHIIKKPAELANLAFEEDPVKKKRLDKILAEEVINDVNALPLLEFALTQLEKRKVFKDKKYYLTTAAYKAIGELQGAIATLAKQTYEELDDKEKEIFEKLLLKLVSINDDHLILTDYVPNQEEKAIVQKFVETRLFVQENEYIRVAHEAFFRYWNFAKKVIENAKSDIIHRDRIVQVYHLYIEQNKNKKALLQGSLLFIAEEILKKRGEEFFGSNFANISNFVQKSIKQYTRQKYIKVSTLLLAMVMFVSLAIYSLYQSKVAQGNLKIAQKEKEKAIKAKNIALDKQERMKFFIKNLIYNLTLVEVDINKTALAIARASINTINLKDKKDYNIANVLIDMSKALDEKGKIEWKALLYCMNDEEIEKFLKILYYEQLKHNAIENKYKKKKRLIRKYYLKQWILKYESDLPKSLHLSNKSIEKYLEILKKNVKITDPDKYFDKKEYKKAVENQIFLVLDTAGSNKKTLQTHRLGNLSWYAVFAQDYDLAIAAAKYALKLDPSQIWIYTNLAHAYLFKGEIEKAKEIYLKYRDKKVGDKTWQEVVVKDFEIFTQRGFHNKNFETINRLLHKK